MLFDVLIRLLAAIEISIIVNAEGITTASVVMSVCTFFMLELSLLFKRCYITCAALLGPFLFAIVWVLWTNRAHTTVKLLLLLIFGTSTLLSFILYKQLQSSRITIHLVRDEDKELEEMLRNQNIQLLKQHDAEINMATLRERNRIAREIHDNVGHLLSRAILLLGAINTVNTDEHIKPQLSLLAGTLDESMQKMRDSVHDLHDDSIDLEHAFQEMIAKLRQDSSDQFSHIETTLDFNEELPRNIKLALIGILQESLTNVIRHSNGDSIHIILRENPGFCTLSVTDNGSIPDDVKKQIASRSQNGIGLYNICERAKSCGGDARFYTDRGFSVFVRLPYDRQQKTTIYNH